MVRNVLVAILLAAVLALTAGCNLNKQVDIRSKQIQIEQSEPRIVKKAKGDCLMQVSWPSSNCGTMAIMADLVLDLGDYWLVKGIVDTYIPKTPGMHLTFLDVCPDTTDGDTNAEYRGIQI